jgi:hypothetical protein
MALSGSRSFNPTLGEVVISAFSRIGTRRTELYTQGMTKELNQANTGLETKLCPVCNEEKSFAEFSKNNSRKDGLQHRCKKCHSEYRKEYSKKEKLTIESKVCHDCLIEKDIKFFSKKAGAKDGYQPQCKECVSKYKKGYYVENCDYIKEKQRSKESDPEKDRAYGKKYRQNNAGTVNAKTARRRSLKRNATPPWLDNISKAQIKWYYDAAAMMEKTSGIKQNVDHIHPINGENFTGLHVPWNLRVISSDENVLKSNNPPVEERNMFWDFTMKELEKAYAIKY